MKLYTEEQVHKIIELAEFGRHITYGELLDEFTPIELPSDEEIEDKFASRDELIDEVTYMFIEGAKWMKEQILNK